MADRKTRLGIGWMVGLALLGSPSLASAGACALTSFQLLSELTAPTWSGGTSGFNQPFATVFQANLSTTQTNGCGGDCPADVWPGDNECGNLVTTPIDVDRWIAGPGQDDYNGYETRLLSNGKWEYRTDVQILAPTVGAKFANSNISFGHREVFDVSSGASGSQPFQFRLRESGIFPGSVVSCPGIYRTTPLLTRYLRVRAAGSAQSILFAQLTVPDTELTLQTNPLYKRIVRDWNFDIQVPANTVLYVDVLYNPAGGTYDSPVVDSQNGLRCDVTVVTSQWIDPFGGIQLFVSPGPGVTATPRSGIAYEPVPEPTVAVGSIAGMLLLTGLGRKTRFRH